MPTPSKEHLSGPYLQERSPCKEDLGTPLHSYCGNGLCKLCSDKSCLVSSLPLSQGLCCVSFWAVLAQSLAQPSRGFQNAPMCCGPARLKGTPREKHCTTRILQNGWKPWDPFAHLQGTLRIGFALAAAATAWSSCL